MNRVLACFLSLSLYSVLLFIPTITSAQVISSDGLLVRPPTPAPNENVTVSLAQPELFSLGSQVQWFVDGIEQTDYFNQTAINLMVGASGLTSQVSARVSDQNGVIENFSSSITPLRVDLVVSANGYTPSFYNGRTLPTRGSTLSVHAIAAVPSPQNYSYYWRVNGELQRNVGQSNTLITFRPGLTAEVFVELEVYNSANQLVAAPTLSVPLYDPELYFYESNPLRGLLPAALTNPYYLLKEEITLRAEPYFMSSTPDNYAIDWTLDGREFAADTNPLEMSLVKSTESGRTNVGVSIINRAGYLETASNNLMIEF